MALKTNNYTEGRARKNTSPSTQRTDCGLRAVKTYGNTKSRVGPKKILGRQRTTTLKVVTKNVPQNVMDKLWCEGCEDGRQHRGSC